MLEVVRVRLADEQPISLERARFPADRFPGLLDRSLSGSLYELLEAGYGLHPSEAEERVEVVGATAAEARVLEVRAGAPLVAIVRTAWAADGRPFERSHDLFRADRVRIVTRVRTARRGGARQLGRGGRVSAVDGRVSRYADVLLDTCLGVQPGWQVLVWGAPPARPLLEVVMAKLAERGAYPLLRLTFGGGLVYHQA